MGLDLTAAIDILGEANLITVTRRVAPTYANGRPTTDPAPTVFALDALVSVAEGEDLERLPEGDRTGEVLVCYTKVPLRAVNMETEAPGDEVAYQGETYDVLTEADWQTQAAVHRCMLRKVEPA